MALTTLFAAALVLAAASAPARPANPIAPALAGQLACTVPNATKKTCGALVGFTWRNDGSVEARAEVMLGVDPAFSFRGRSVGRVRPRAFCQIVVSEHIEAVEFLVDGAKASRRVTEQGHELMFHALSDFIGREVCMSFVANGSSLRMVMTADGREVPQFTAPMIWVAPNDGYSVKP
jgi:hypothetical protein